MGDVFDSLKENLIDDLLKNGVIKTKSSVCNICLTESLSGDCVQLQCKHIFCKDCFENFLNHKITMNEVSLIRCPISEDCHSEILYDFIIRNISSKELLEKYDKKLLENCLHTENDIIQCPKVECNKVVMLTDESPTLGFCETCNFVFCTNCREDYHGITPCDQFESDAQKKELTKCYMNADELVKSSLEKRYTKKKLQESVDQYMNELCIKENCKPCPSCRVNIEKNGGCNQMLCTKCNRHFCWLCNSILEKTDADAHTHFNRGNCVLFNYA
ncbi:uncharacterized protein B4U80_09709, partial [Leptotrombidium deliense]